MHTGAHTCIHSLDLPVSDSVSTLEAIASQNMLQTCVLQTLYLVATKADSLVADSHLSIVDPGKRSSGAVLFPLYYYPCMPDLVYVPKCGNRMLPVHSHVPIFEEV